MNRENQAAVMRIAKAVRPFDLNAERARMDGAIIAMMELREVSDGTITLAEIGAVMQRLFHVKWEAKHISVNERRARERITRPHLSAEIEAIAHRRGAETNGKANH